MSTTFNLEKEEEKVKFMLEKRDIKNMIAAVALNIDVSGSMRSIFTSGTVQKALQRVLPVALNFDDNRNLDVNLFSEDDAEIESVTEDNFATFVQDEILDEDLDLMWSGTKYAGAIKMNLEKYGLYKSKSKTGFFARLTGSNTEKTLQSDTETGYPAVVYMLTDGENSDKSETENLFKQIEAANSNIYFLFIGIGQERFSFIKSMADEFKNVGFVKADDLAETAEDDKMYDLLLPEELTQWLRTKNTVATK